MDMSPGISWGGRMIPEERLDRAMKEVDAITDEQDLDDITENELDRAFYQLLRVRDRIETRKLDGGKVKVVE